MKTLIPSIAIMLFTLPALAEEKLPTDHGKTLHDKHCTSCHIGMTGGDDSTLYTRSNRKIKSRASLETQVQRCATNLDIQWFEDDVKAVADYLDKTWYKFSR